jgi:hypothetical protein
MVQLFCATSMKLIQHHQLYLSLQSTWIIKNWGRVYDPISINLLNVSNIDKIHVGKDQKKKRGLMTVYLKEGVQLISFKELLNRYDIDRRERKRLPVYIDNTRISKPKKLLFDPSQMFTVEIIPNFDKPQPIDHQFLRISLKK